VVEYYYHQQVYYYITMVDGKDTVVSITVVESPWWYHSAIYLFIKWPQRLLLPKFRCTISVFLLGVCCM